MFLRKILPFSVMAIAIVGCATVTPEERRKADEKTCLSYGFRRNTDAFSTCLQRIDLDRRAEARALRYGNDPMMWGWDRPVIIR